MPDDDFPLLSLRSPWPQSDPRETSLSALIPRIFNQRGHFKDVNEAILEAEIAAAKDSEHGHDNIYSRGEPAENGDRQDNGKITITKAAEDGEMDRATQLRNAKMEMLALVGYAAVPFSGAGD
jgi:mediator of RNA polymerase II transcription subunit 17